MSDSLIAQQREEITELIGLLCSDELNEDEVARLESIVSNSVAAMNYYLRQMNLRAGLHWRKGIDEATALETNPPAERKRGQFDEHPTNRADQLFPIISPRIVAIMTITGYNLIRWPLSSGLARFVPSDRSQQTR